VGRLVELRIDGEPVDPEETYSVATFRRPMIPNATSKLRVPVPDVEVDDDTIPADVIVEYLEEHSPVDYEVMGLNRETAGGDGGRVQNTPADGPVSVYPARRRLRGPARAYYETSMIPRRNTFPDAGRNRTRFGGDANATDPTNGTLDTAQVRYDGQQHHCGTTSRGRSTPTNSSTLIDVRPEDSFEAWQCVRDAGERVV